MTLCFMTVSLSNSSSGLHCHHNSRTSYNSNVNNQHISTIHHWSVICCIIIFWVILFAQRIYISCCPDQSKILEIFQIRTFILEWKAHKLNFNKCVASIFNKQTPQVVRNNKPVVTGAYNLMLAFKKKDFFPNMHSFA